MTCPICHAQGARVAHAVSAPWICELSGSNESHQVVAMYECSDCAFKWFLPRPTMDLMDSLYSNYRGSEYLAARRRWEPWYRPEWNAELDPGRPGATARRHRIDSLASGLPDAAFSVVVDIGGDQGQFFPTRSLSRFVVDPSDRELLEGVVRATSLAEVPPPTLVLMGCLLPHIDDPLAFLIQVRASAPDAMLWVEMAQDAPRLQRFHARDLYLRWLALLSKSRTFFIFLDFMTGAFRNFGFRVPRFGVVKMSEHINYLPPRCVEQLLQQAGYRIVATELIPQNGIGRIRLGSLAVLASPIAEEEPAQR